MKSAKPLALLILIALACVPPIAAPTPLPIPTMTPEPTATPTPLPTSTPTYTPTPTPTLTPSPIPASTATPTPTLTPTPLPTPTPTLSQIIEKYKRAIGKIRASDSSGTGFVIDSRKGYLLTANHVVEYENTVKVEFPDGLSTNGKVIASNYEKDLALIQLDRSPDIQIPLASNEPQLGEDAIVVGYPLSAGLSITRGVVSAIVQGRNANVRYIQTDSPMNPGNSGGPLLNQRGEAIGVVDWKVPLYLGIEGVGFAVSVKSVTEALPSLVAQRSEEPASVARLLPMLDNLIGWKAGSVKGHNGRVGLVVFWWRGDKHSLSFAVANASGSTIFMRGFDDVILTTNKGRRIRPLEASRALHGVGLPVADGQTSLFYDLWFPLDFGEFPSQLQYRPQNIPPMITVDWDLPSLPTPTPRPTPSPAPSPTPTPTSTPTPTPTPAPMPVKVRFAGNSSISTDIFNVPGTSVEAKIKVVNRSLSRNSVKVRLCHKSIRKGYCASESRMTVPVLWSLTDVNTLYESAPVTVIAGPGEFYLEVGVVGVLDWEITIFP